MSARPQIFHEFPPDPKSAVRERLMYRATKTTRRLWSEWTNDGEWHYGWQVYRLIRHQDGSITLNAADVLDPRSVKRLRDDLRELSG